jgi:hypothetical protein
MKLADVPCSRHPVIKGMVDSYNTAINDPKNELIHLFEIPDAAKKHFGRGVTACAALNFKLNDWNRLSKLANYEPLEQGRHRGTHHGALRPATEEELVEARTIARRIVEATMRRICNLP